VVSEPQKHVIDLLRQFARGRNDQRLRQTSGQAKKLVKDWQQEGRGLARARLRGVWKGSASSARRSPI
jgi:hypothetical protein